MTISYASFLSSSSFLTLYIDGFHSVWYFPSIFLIFESGSLLAPIFPSINASTFSGDESLLSNEKSWPNFVFNKLIFSISSSGILKTIFAVTFSRSLFAKNDFKFKKLYSKSTPFVVLIDSNNAITLL